MRTTYLLIAGALAAFSFASCTSGGLQPNADGNYVVNTTETGKDIRGFGGPTPLEVTISKDGKIEKITALQNSETPDFFKKVEEELIPKLVGKTSTDGVDAVSGATFSSKAVLENTKLALEEVAKNK